MAASPRFGRRVASALIALALSLLCLGACRSHREVTFGPTFEARTTPLHLVVLHTNDVHGQVLPRETSRSGPDGSGGLKRVAAHVRKVRSEEAGPDTGVLVLDGGDWFQGTPEGMLDGGRGFVRALSAVGYDALAVGNHEFDLGTDHLRGLLEEAPHAVAANLRRPDAQGAGSGATGPGGAGSGRLGPRVDWVAPWRVVEVAGLRIALVGLVTTETPSITHEDASELHFADPVEELGRVRDELAGEYDILIPVGHIGIDDGKRLAEAFGEVPLVVTGHTHTYLREGIRAGNALVVQAGDKATVIGRADLWLEASSDPDGSAVRWSVRESSARLEPLEVPVGADEPHANAAVGALAEDLVARAEAVMGGVVGELTAPLTRGRGPASSVAGNWITDLMRARTGADIAVHNRGGTRTNLSAGPVTQRNVYELLPFDNDLVTFELKGAELWALAVQALGGDGAGRLDFSGLTVTLSGASGAATEVGSLEVGGAALDPDRSYTVTTNSFLARGGDGYELFNSAEQIGHDPVLLRELVLEAFRRTPRVQPPSDARIVFGGTQ